MVVDGAGRSGHTRTVDRYELGSVPRRLRRRAATWTTLAMVAVALVLLSVIALFEGIRPSAATWLVVGAVVLACVAVVVVGVRRLDPDDRATLEAGHRRVLEPLVDPGRRERLDVARLDVELRPGPIRRRRLADRPDRRRLSGDAVGLHVPVWLLEAPPRGLDRFGLVTIRWADVEHFRVTASSDSPDTYDVTVRPDRGRPSRWRIRRNEIVDEVAVLDFVRTTGGLAVHLEANVA